MKSFCDTLKNIVEELKMEHSLEFIQILEKFSKIKSKHLLKNKNLGFFQAIELNYVLSIVQKNILSRNKIKVLFSLNLLKNLITKESLFS